MATPNGTAAAARQAASGYALRALPRRKTYTTSWDINVCYTMEAIDELIRDSVNLAKMLKEPSELSVRLQLGEQLLSNWSSTIASLNRLIEMIDLYLDGRSDEIVLKQYDFEKYQEL